MRVRPLAPSLSLQRRPVRRQVSRHRLCAELPCLRVQQQVQPCLPSTRQTDSFSSCTPLCCFPLEHFGKCLALSARQIRHFILVVEGEHPKLSTADPVV